MVMAMATAAGCTLPSAPAPSKTNGTSPSGSSDGASTDPSAPPASSDTPSSGAQGNVPAALVGKWSFASSSMAAMYELSADGTYRYTGTVDNDLSCSKIEIFESGTATADETQATFAMTDGRNVTGNCDGTSKTDPMEPKVETKAWRVANDTLFLWDASQCDGSEMCAEQYEKVQ